MNLAEIIYEKSKDLPDDLAAEVIDFIDFLKERTRPPTMANGDDAEDAVRRRAQERLSAARIHWDCKPIPSRDSLYDGARG